MTKKTLVPVVKLRADITHPGINYAIPAVVIKMQDFLRMNGKPNMTAIQKIRSAGGLREYLNPTGRVILSPIMRDDLLLKINFDIYEYLIEELRPDQYITPDGITYTGFIKYSRNQLDLILKITDKLQDRFPNYTPIGLVKGSNLSQMDFHLDNLLERGIKQVCLHAGDFLYKESNYSRDQIVDYARYIREKVSHLIIYGVGSRHYFQRFHTADSFVTNSHFMQAINHKVISGAKWVNYSGDPTREIVMKNFNYLRRLIEGLHDVRDLSEWVSGKTIPNIDEKITEKAPSEGRIMKILEG